MQNACTQEIKRQRCTGQDDECHPDIGLNYTNPAPGAPYPTRVFAITTQEAGITLLHTPVGIGGSLTGRDTGRRICDFSDPLFRNEKNSYNLVLPQANLRVELRDDLLLRLAGGKVLSRPGFADMNPSSTGNAVSRSVTSGNPTLDPVTAAQADIALEWYFSDYAIASIGVFKKWGQGFIDVDVREQTLTEIDPTTNQPFVLNV